MNKMVKIMALTIALCVLFSVPCWADDFSPNKVKGKIALLTETILTALPNEANAKPVVAVVDIQMENAEAVDPGLAGFIQSQLIEKLHNSNRFTLVDRQNIQQVVKELFIHSEELLVDPKTAKSFGKQLGADILAIPSITLVQSSLQLELKMTSVETGQIMAVASIQLLDRLSPELRKEAASAMKFAASLDQAAAIITAGVKQANIFIYPPSTGTSNEVTQFAETLKNKLAEKLHTASQEDKAGYFLNGSYQIMPDGIELIYNLLDNKYKVIATKVIKLAPAAYRNLQIQPQNESLSRLLNQEDYVASGLRAEIKSNKGSRNLIFKKGEEVELLVKLNKAGYFYAVGHTKKPGEDYSYLMPLGNGEGQRKFVYSVNDATVNKWISLGKFEVTPPFGLESIQIISSEKEPAKIPDYIFDKSTELYMIAANAEEGVVRTRALKPKPAADNGSAEAVLVFTTSL